MRMQGCLRKEPKGGKYNQVSQGSFLNRNRKRCEEQVTLSLLDCVLLTSVSHCVFGSLFSSLSLQKFFFLCLSIHRDQKWPPWSWLYVIFQIIFLTEYDQHLQGFIPGSQAKRYVAITPVDGLASTGRVPPVPTSCASGRRKPHGTNQLWAVSSGLWVHPVFRGEE